MSLVKYNDDFFGPFFTKLPSVFEDIDDYFPTQFKKRAEMLEVSEDAKKVYVKASLPGIKPADVDINIKGNLLSIKADSAEDSSEKKGRKVVFSSRMQNSFSYVTTLPCEVNSKSAKAVIKNGMLSLELDKTEERGTKIKVVEEK